MSVPQSLVRSRRAVAVAAGAVAVLSLAAPASAKESAGVFSTAPGVITTSTSCSPIQSLKITGSASTGDTGLASILVDYQVRPCDSKQVLSLETMVADYFDPSVVLYDDPAAPLSGKFGLGVQIARNYRVTLVVRDATTGATVAQVDRLANVPRPTGV